MRIFPLVNREKKDLCSTEERTRSEAYIGTSNSIAYAAALTQRAKGATYGKYMGSRKIVIFLSVLVG